MLCDTIFVRSYHNLTVFVKCGINDSGNTRCLCVVLWALDFEDHLKRGADMDLNNVQEYLSKKCYTQDENGKFVIDISERPIDKWGEIFSYRNEKYPYFALQDAMETIKEEFPAVLAKKIAEDLIEKATDEEITGIEKNLRQMVVITYSMDDILKRVVNVDIGIDTGDSGWDFHANTIEPACGICYRISAVKNVSSIVWLAKQQGYRLSQLQFALKNIVKHRELINNEFLESAAYEVWHEMGDENQLFCLVKMTVEDMLIINSLMRWRRETKKWAGYIVINTDAKVGFYSHWYGSTSLLGIKLEKELKLPLWAVHVVLPDESFDSDSEYGYSIQEVVDDDTLWGKGRVVYMSLPKHFRLSMESMGLRPIKKNERKYDT